MGMKMQLTPWNVHCNHSLQKKVEVMHPLGPVITADKRRVRLQSSVSYNDHSQAKSIDGGGRGPPNGHIFSFCSFLVRHHLLTGLFSQPFFNKWI